MKYVLMLIFSFLIFPPYNAVYSQSQKVTALLDTTINIMQKQSVNTKLVDWKKIRDETLTRAKSITDPYQLGPVIRDLYKALNDYHGAFYYKDSTFRWNYKEPKVSDSIMREWKRGAGVKTAFLEDNIGYLRIPGMQFSGRQSSDSNAQKLNDSLCHLLKKGVKGLIIDLRLNGGGAMYPMILGVQQLLEKGQVGSFRSAKEEKWYLTETSFSFDTTMLASIKPTCTTNGQKIPIAFLISPPTGSSAEFLLIAFKGRARTILVGTETAGFVTGVEGFPINDAAYILLSTSYGIDRKGVVYKSAFKPDIIVNSNDSFNNVKQDEKVKQAVKWLKQGKDK